MTDEASALALEHTMGALKLKQKGEVIVYLRSTNLNSLRVIWNLVREQKIRVLASSTL